MLGRGLFVAVLALVVVSAAAAGHGRLRLASRGAFAVLGSDFHPSEHVKLVASAGETSVTRRVTAGPAGGFVARFPSIRVDPSCALFHVRATGDMGTSAALTVRQPECAQPKQP